jgi:hypothetical protein
MELAQLKETLKQLQQELKSGAPLDAETQALLLQLSGEIHALATRASSANPPAGPAVSPDKQSVLDRLGTLTEQFEETHPRLAETIGNLASALSQMGI